MLIKNGLTLKIGLAKKKKKRLTKLNVNVTYNIFFMLSVRVKS